VNVQPGIDVKGYVPNVYEHFAASDLAVVQAGNTSTIELTALKKPFIYFPLKDHYEQRIHVSHRLRRHNAGVFMDYANTTPQSLADAIVQNLGKKVDYADIPIYGAQKAAQFISKLL
jgi:UDP-N-acetylglucosamine:LPS N-acetylglucosamine transferase